MPAPRLSRRACCSADCRRRLAPSRTGASAFTLVELLVAITIIATVVGIAVSGLFGRRDSNRLLATEQLVSDMVRQARHTTRSSGEPVELRISKIRDGNNIAIGGRIAGVSRQAVWSQSFDDPANLPGPGTIPNFSGDLDPATGFTFGRSGFGLWPATSTVAPALMQAQLSHALTKAQQLAHGSAAGGADAFYLACCVRPPPADQAWVAAVTPDTTPLEIPLMLLGDGNLLGQPEFTPRSTTPKVPPAYVPSSIAGLKLVLKNITATNATPSSPATRSQFCWDLQGWVTLPGASSTSIILITSLIGQDPAFGPQQAIAGGRWEDLGLLYDGVNLQLFRDGHILLQGDGMTPIQVPTNATDSTMVNRLAATDYQAVYFGEQTPAGATEPMFADAPIDDVRIFRLATDQTRDLPAGVVPEWTGVLEFRPDGTMMPPRADPIDAQIQDLPPLGYAITLTPGVTTGIVRLVMAQGAVQATTTGVTIPTLAFSKRVHGQRDNSPLSCAVVTVPANGPLSSALGSLGRDSGGSTMYLVTAAPVPPP